MIPKEVSLLKQQWINGDLSESQYLEGLGDYINVSNIKEIFEDLPPGRIRNAFYEEVKEWVKSGERVFINSAGDKPPEWWTPINWSLNQKELVEAAKWWLSTRNQAMFYCTECGYILWKNKEDIDCDGLEEHTSCPSCGIGLMKMNWDDNL